MNRLHQHQRMRRRHQVKGQKVVSTYRTFAASTSNRKQEVNMVRINSKALQTYSYHILLVLIFSIFNSRLPLTQQHPKNLQYLSLLCTIHNCAITIRLFF